MLEFILKTEMIAIHKTFDKDATGKRNLKQKRKEFDGRETYERFAAYCKKAGLELTEETLALWDAQHNESRIRESFGSREDVYQRGLKELYRRFLSDNCLRIPNGAPVRLPSGRVYQPTVRELRRSAGESIQLREVTAKQTEVIREQFRIELRQLLRTQKFFNMAAGDIRQIVKDELEAALADKD